MNVSQVLVKGTLKTDGTLELSEVPTLPAGPVEVLIRMQPPAADNAETWWEYLQRRHAELRAEGQTFRSKDEIDADRARQRSMDEARRRSLRGLQAPQE